ncbi:alpha/beta hydrolase [Pelomonas sp. KK5]|uniref:alpha/beta hydrolase n=1 Tax=Pelomonas sp. KK5 TaxID=1855730 RepID=UPI0018E9D671|nr:alpha/beta fold hydrolase [Pelomonas sp. KK5]
MSTLPFILGLLGALVAGVLMAVAWLYFHQERSLFEAEPLPPDHRFSMLAADVEEVSVPVPGATLSALHLKQAQPRGLVFYLHGNAGNLERWFVNADFYRQAGWDLFMIDYRGYGKSSGRIRSEAELRADVRAAWDFIAPRYGDAPRVIYGRSLGTGLATGLAAEVQPALTILVSPYLSMQAVTDLHFPYVPRRVLRYPLRSDRDLPRIEGPVLLLHGTLDTLIPPSHSESLLPLARRGELALIEGAAHNDLQEHEPYLSMLRAALDSASRPQHQP